MKKIKIGNIFLLNLKGSSEEMAYQHGFLLREEIQNSALRQLANKNQFMISQAGGLLANKIFNKLAIKLYEKIYIPMVSLSLPIQEKRNLKALCKGANIQYEMLLRAFYQADGLMALSKLSLMGHLFSKFPKKDLPGCSSAVVSREFSESNRMLVMRNQDYPIVGNWERLTTVAYCKPTNKKQIPYIFVTSAGLHTAGLTAMNKKGVTVAVHAHFGKSVTLTGVPIFHLSEKIISHAHNLETAEKIIRKTKTHANWTIVVTSSFENKAAAFEITPKKYFRRNIKEGTLTHTNFFQNPHLNQQEALISGARHNDDHARINQMDKVIREKKGKINVSDMMSICGDHHDPHSNSKKIFGNTISVITTVKSVVFDPEKFELYVSNRDKTPVGIGDFIKITEKSFDEPSKFEIIKNTHQYDDKFLKDLEYYRLSYIAGQMNGDYKTAYQYLTRICKPGHIDPHLNLQCGYLAIKLGKFDDALYYMDKVDQKKITPHINHCLTFFKSLIYKELGDEVNYQRYSIKMNEKICKKLSKSIKKTKSIKDIQKNIMIDMQFPEPIEY